MKFNNFDNLNIIFVGKYKKKKKNLTFRSYPIVYDYDILSN